MSRRCFPRKPCSFYAGCCAVAVFVFLLVNHHAVVEDAAVVEMPIPRCGCAKAIPAPAKSSEVASKNDSTCSTESFLRGSGQKVVAFTFYESDEDDRKVRGYLQGIRENLRLMERLYPAGFVLRLYYEVLDAEGETMKELCRMACEEPRLDLCDPAENPKLGRASRLYPLLWRFLPAVDGQVEVFFSRDLDSRIGEREVSCVEEFLASEPHLVHVMRDHPAHTAYVMGGLWGAKVDRARKQLRNGFGMMFRDGLAYLNRSVGLGYDQHALARHVWPWAKKVAMCHDSHTCKRFSGTFPFPTRRRENQVGNYVGSVVKLNASIGTECPLKCRPKDHKDWTLC